MPPLDENLSDTEALLVAYVDGELGPEAILEAEHLIATSASARATVDAHRRVTALLRAACGEQAYASGVEDLLPAVLHGPRRALPRYGWIVGAALAACVAGFVGGAQVVSRPTSKLAHFVAEVAEYHGVFAGEDRHLVELGPDRIEEFTSWLGKRLDRQLAVPDLSAEGLSYAGGRMLVSAGQPVAQMVYTRSRGRPIALCITKLDGTPRAISQDKLGSQRTASWEDGKYAYVVVGEIDPDLIRAIATDASRQIRS